MATAIVQILPAEVLSGTNGVFDASTGQIYLSDTFVVENINDPSALTMVLLEEFGHYLDAQLNLADSVGDEGEIFAYLVQGITLSEPELMAMKADDDRMTITLDNQEHAVEHSTPVTGLPSSPDLAPITATTVYSKPLFLSGSYPVSWSIGNFGGRAPSQYWTDGLYASNDPFFDSSDFQVDTWFVPGDYLKGNLQPGHFYSRYRLAQNYSWTPRRQFLLLVVDSQNVIAETNEYNNVRVFEVGPLLGNFDNIPLPSELKAEDVAQNSYNHLPACGGPAVKGFNSDVELHTGAVVETHNLVTYKSLGDDRGLGLRYNSLHADPRPILHFGYSDVKGQAGKDQLLIAKLSIDRGEFEYEVPGYEGSQ
jgi:CARDB